MENIGCFGGKLYLFTRHLQGGQACAPKVPQYCSSPFPQGRTKKDQQVLKAHSTNSMGRCESSQKCFKTQNKCGEPCSELV